MSKNSNKTGYILRASITTKDGSKIYAKDHGKKAFRIPITKTKQPKGPSKSK